MKFKVIFTRNNVAVVMGKRRYDDKVFLPEFPKVKTKKALCRSVAFTSRVVVWDKKKSGIS